MKEKKVGIKWKMLLASCLGSHARWQVTGHSDYLTPQCKNNTCQEAGNYTLNNCRSLSDER